MIEFRESIGFLQQLAELHHWFARNALTLWPLDALQAGSKPLKRGHMACFKDDLTMTYYDLKWFTFWNIWLFLILQFVNWYKFQEETCLRLQDSMVTDDFHVQHGICWYIPVYFGQLWKIMIHLGISRSLGWVPKMVWPLAMVQPIGCRPGVKRLLLRSATVQCVLSCIVAIRSFPRVDLHRFLPCCKT